MAGVESTTGADRTGIELVNGVDAAGVDTAGTELTTDFGEAVFFDRLIELRVFNSFGVATLSFKSISLPLTSSKNVTIKVLIHLFKLGV